MQVLACRQAAVSMDAGLPSATMEAAMAKRFATDACFQVADDAVQVSCSISHACDSHYC